MLRYNTELAPSLSSTQDNAIIYNDLEFERQRQLSVMEKDAASISRVQGTTLTQNMTDTHQHMDAALPQQLQTWIQTHKHKHKNY
eukprot:2130394-Amphidinium_carterae.2